MGMSDGSETKGDGNRDLDGEERRPRIYWVTTNLVGNYSTVADSSNTTSTNTLELAYSRQ